LPGQTDGRVEQAVVAADALALVPEQLAVAVNIQVRLEMPRVEALATGRATEGDHVPVTQAGVAFELNAGAELGLGTAIDDGFLGQPLQGGAGADLELKPLIGGAFGSIPFGRAGAGQLRPSVGTHRGGNVQTVTAGNPARWVDDDVLANLGTFAVQVLLHPQRAFVTAQRRTRGLAVTAIAQLQLGMPAGGEQGDGDGCIHGA
jgi:hypothetical protein